MSKKVLLIIAHENFQPIEYGVPKKILLDAGIEVLTASNKSGIAVAARTGEKVQVDVALDEVRIENYDGIFFIGGPGALEHLDNEESYRIIRQIEAQNGRSTRLTIWGAICISPRILAKTQALKNKKVTGWNGDDELEKIFAHAGANYVPDPVVVDGNLITAEGPTAAEEFAKRILDKI